ncbi:hypothetical protein CDL12_13405 [Handroanthus impetiginosus]|uniref:Uncharacterized protein n=1 Tax=Handroanthus impetiginosus TaxID=429701 RepID=A0A2G9H908_9LAMI|nr:hypothetical protein CDL12_13405 [Handroanthus impetiginosus]
MNLCLHSMHRALLLASLILMNLFLCLPAGVHVRIWLCFCQMHADFMLKLLIHINLITTEFHEIHNNTRKLMYVRS